MERNMVVRRRLKIFRLGPENIQANSSACMAGVAPAVAVR